MELEKTISQSLQKALEGKGDSHLFEFVDDFLEEQVGGIRGTGEMITEMKRVGEGLGLHILDKEMMD